MTQSNAAMDLETTLMNASPLTLVVMAYEKAIEKLETAVKCIDSGDIEGRWRNIETATDIISELYMTLNHEQGGEVVENLSCLYGFILSRLPRVNFYNDRQTAIASIKIMAQLKASWEELARQGIDSAMASAAMSASSGAESAAAAGM